MENKIIIFCDGGSRGNPGKSAAAFVVVENGKMVYSQANFLGVETNNFAEYSAVLNALSWVRENKDKINKEIIFNLDSELVVKQINGLYKVKNVKLKEIHIKIKNILENLHFKIIFKNISREKNAKADFLVNQKLNNLP
jgi:ribonuclease HI